MVAPSTQRLVTVVRSLALAALASSIVAPEVLTGVGGFATGLGVDSVAFADDRPAAGAVAYPVAIDRAPTLASLRRTFRGRRVWRVTRYGESDPDFPIRGFCIGRARTCAIEIVLTTDGHVHAVEVRDSSFTGPRGIRVGETYRSLEAVLMPGCIVSLGDQDGLYCDVVGEPNVRVGFMAPGLYGPTGRTSETPTEAELDAARVVGFFWGAPDR